MNFAFFFADELYIYLSFFLIYLILVSICIFFLTCRNRLPCWFVFFAIDFSLSRIQWPVQPKPEGGIVIKSSAPRSLKITSWWRVVVFFLKLFPFDKSYGGCYFDTAECRGCKVMSQPVVMKHLVFGMRMQVQKRHSQVMRWSLD